MKCRESFKTPQNTFTLVGIDIGADDPEVIIKRPLLTFGIYVITLIFLLVSIDYCIKNTHNINEFILVVSVLNPLIITQLKFVILLLKRKRINKLIKYIWQWNDNVNDEEYQIFAEKSKKNALISKFYYSTSFSTGVSGLSIPFITKLLKSLHGIKAPLELPHNASYFWDTSSYMGYTIAYLWNVIIVHFLINAAIGVDTLFMWLVSNILIRFNILKMRLEKAAKQYHQQQKTSFYSIRDIVQFHLHILDLADELDSIFRAIIFIKSSLSCTQICFLAFCFMSNDRSFIFVLYTFVFLFSVSMQLLLYCYYGQIIEEQSLNVSTNVYEAFNWDKISPSHQKMLQMIMIRSQKSSNISGIFFNLNLDLFLWFFKRATSLIAVLNTLKADQ